MKRITDRIISIMEDKYGDATTLKETKNSIHILIPEFKYNASKTFEFIRFLDDACGGDTVVQHLDNNEGIMNITLGFRS